MSAGQQAAGSSRVGSWEADRSSGTPRRVNTQQLPHGPHQPLRPCTPCRPAAALRPPLRASPALPHRTCALCASVLSMMTE